MTAIQACQAAAKRQESDGDGDAVEQDGKTSDMHSQRVTGPSRYQRAGLSARVARIEVKKINAT